MTTYRIIGTVGVSCWTDVEAESPEEAVRLAAQRGLADHHIDGSFGEDESWHFDNDGTPGNLRVED